MGHGSCVNLIKMNTSGRCLRQIPSFFICMYISIFMFISAMLITGFDWFISETGTDSQDCGLRTDTCSSLPFVVNHSKSGDHIFIIGTFNSSHVFYHCSAQIITKNLTFVGIGPSQPSVGCEVPSRVEWYGDITYNRSAPILFHLKENEIHLVNLKLTNGYLLATNNMLNMIDCVVEDLVIYLMDQLTFIEHDRSYKNSAFFEAFITELYIGYLMKENKVESSMTMARAFSCLTTILTISNVTWTHITWNVTEFIPVDVLVGDGIQAICIQISIEIYNSFLADRVIYAAGVEQMYLNLQSSRFEGRNTGTSGFGGVDLGSFCTPLIVIKDTEFSGLRYVDLASPLMASSFFPTAAFRVHFFEHSLIKEKLCQFCKQYENRPYNPDVVILNTTFENSMGGVAFSSAKLSSEIFCSEIGFVSKKVLALITDSKFLRNEKVSHGGGVHVKTGPVLKLSISNCMFANNKAGVRAFGMPLLIKKRRVLKKESDELGDIKNYKSIDESVVQFTFDRRQYEDLNMTVNIAGIGGALYLQGNTADIRNCHFLNNTATSLGGSIFISRKTTVVMKNCQFFSENKDTNITNGVIMYSQGTRVTISDVEFHVASLPPHKAAIIYHDKDLFEEGVLEDGIIQLTNIKINCSPDSKLKIINISSIRHSMNYLRSNKIFTFKTLRYFCVPCLANTYTLETGFYQITGPEATLSPEMSLEKFPNVPIPPPPPRGFLGKYTHNITYVDFPCKPCPYGAKCQGTLQSKLNYWGFKARDEIKFYFCPFGYCCTRRQCGKFNQCASFRSGILCGTCKNGYSEALFSVKCVPDNLCKDYWMLAIGLFLSVVYGLFLLFQNDVKQFVHSAPIGTETILSHLVRNGSNVKGSHNAVDTVVYMNSPEDQSQTSFTAVESARLDTAVYLETNGTANCRNRNISVVSADFKESVDDQTRDNPSTQCPIKSHEKTRKREEGGIFLILLFYYFQDASIIQITTPYTEPDDYEIRLLKTIIGGLFKFQLHVLHFASSVCISTSIKPEVKIVIKLLFIPAIFTFLFILYGISKYAASKTNTTYNGFARKVQAKVPVAIMLAILFSFQKLAASAISLVYCVPFESKSVLFIDGNLECYTFWQIIIVVYLSTSILPFCIYITFATTYLKNGRLSLCVYFIGCFLPVPVLLYLVLRENICTKILSTENDNTDALRVYNLLQGPYKDYDITIKTKTFIICYSGVLLIRRSILIVLYTFIHNLSLRLLLMVLLCIFALVLQTYSQPCKERRSNVAAFISNTSLVIVSCINLVKAAFVTSEYEPIGPIVTFTNMLQSVEECLLFWIPVIGFGIVIIIVLGRGILKIASNIKTSQ